MPIIRKNLVPAWSPGGWLALFGLLVLSACGGRGGSESPTAGGSPPAAAQTEEVTPPAAEAEEPPGIDACTLLTPNDYAAVMGAKSEKTEQSTTGIFHFCSFSESGNVGSATIGASRTSADYFDSTLKNETQLVGQQAEEVAVAGGKAYWLTESRLVVGYKNGIFFRVSAGTPIETKTKAAALSKRVTEHIP